MDAPAPSEAAAPRAFRRTLIKVAVSLVVLAACGWYFWKKVDLAGAWSALVQADYWLVAAAAVVNMVLHLPAKSVRWWLMLAPMKRLPQHRVYNYLLAGYAASNLLPARMGEAVRIWFVAKDGVPVGGATGTQLLEKVYEVLGLIVFVLPLPLVLPELPGSARIAIALVGVGGVVGVVVMYFVARHGEKSGGTTRLARLLKKIGEGMANLRAPRALALAILLSIATWVIDAWAVILCMHAVGIEPSFWAAAFMLLGLNLAIALPSTPAQLGVFEGSIVIALEILGLPRDRALAFAVLYHVMQIVPVTLYGGIMLARYGVPKPPEPTGASEIKEPGTRS